MIMKQGGCCASSEESSESLNSKNLWRQRFHQNSRQNTVNQNCLTIFKDSYFLYYFCNQEIFKNIFIEFRSTFYDTFSFCRNEIIWSLLEISHFWVQHFHTVCFDTLAHLLATDFTVNKCLGKRLFIFNRIIHVCWLENV